MPKINVELVATAVLDGADTISLTTGNLNLKDTLQLVQEINIVCREAESARWQREIFNTFTNLVSYYVIYCFIYKQSVLKNENINDKCHIVLSDSIYDIASYYFWIVLKTISDKSCFIKNINCVSLFYY